MRKGAGRKTMAAGLLALAMLVGLQAEADPVSMPDTYSERSDEAQARGDALADRLAAQHGGPYANAELGAYVTRVGRRLVAVSEQADEPWDFTVLDSPVINAFALPGGHVFVTRGLIALANSEAELAGVMAHEIGHVTAGHSGSRQTRGAVATGLMIGAQVLGAIFGVDNDVMRAGAELGQLAAGGILASYSREDELAADRLSLRYLARAGYDPFAQADFLQSLAAWQELQAHMKGKDGDPNAAGIFSSHPATPERIRQATALAREIGAPADAARYRDRYLTAIDGIAFGDSAAQGFVRGRTFSHPALGFTFTVPKGFTIANSPDAVRASGPQGARFIMDGAPNPSGSLGDYILEKWVPAIGRQFPIGEPGRARPRRINGLKAATVTLPVRIGDRQMEATLTALRLGDSLYRLAALAPRGSNLQDALATATESFRRLSAKERTALSQQHLRIVTIGRGDTAADLTARMSGPFAAEKFRVLNALGDRAALQRGRQVKIVR